VISKYDVYTCTEQLANDIASFSDSNRLLVADADMDRISARWRSTPQTRWSIYWYDDVMYLVATACGTAPHAALRYQLLAHADLV